MFKVPFLQLASPIRAVICTKGLSLKMFNGFFQNDDNMRIVVLFTHAIGLLNFLIEKTFFIGPKLYSLHPLFY
jgi:hypothetical protein